MQKVASWSFITLGWAQSSSVLTSRRTIFGIPSSSRRSRSFFSASTSPVAIRLARYTALQRGTAHQAPLWPRITPSRKGIICYPKAPSPIRARHSKPSGSSCIAQQKAALTRQGGYAAVISKDRGSRIENGFRSSCWHVAHNDEQSTTSRDHRLGRRRPARCPLAYAPGGENSLFPPP